jgi:hypothetical protein
MSHRQLVQRLLDEAAARHERLLARLSPELRSSLPVDAQGITQAIDHLAAAAGFSLEQRRALVRPHALNPAVMHARVFGAAPLERETVVAAFVEGARVRADALGVLADAVGGEPLGRQVRELLVGSPLPAGAEDPHAVEALRAAYSAQERAALLIACALEGAG